MIVDDDKVVSISYELKVDGEVVDAAFEATPLEFLFGRGMLIPGFEANIKGKGVGEAYEFTIPCGDGYGEVNGDAIVEVPRSAFGADPDEVSELLEVGARLPMLDQDGNSIEGTVIEVADDFVVMDFNHPLAGEDLHFKGRIEAIREATPTELEHGHVHGKSAGCGC